MPTVKYHYPHNRSDYGVRGRDFGISSGTKRSQVGSLAGAAHLLNDNASVPR